MKAMFEISRWYPLLVPVAPPPSSTIEYNPVKWSIWSQIVYWRRPSSFFRESENIGDMYQKWAKDPLTIYGSFIVEQRQSNAEIHF